MPGVVQLAVLALLVLLPGSASSQQVRKTATQVELRASTLEGATRTQATFTAHVTPAQPADGRAAPPTGSVSFMDGEQSIGSAFVDAEGRATYTVDALPAGAQQITAVYDGDDSFDSSNSAVAAVNSLASGVPGFTLSASTTALKVVAGGTATTVIAATPANGFNQSVSLSCSGAPYVSVTCIFSPAQVTPGAATTAAPNGVAALSTLSIQTIAKSGASLRKPLPDSQEPAYALVVPGMLALVGLGLAGRRSFGSGGRAVKGIALAFLLVAGTMSVGGCAQRYRYFHRPPADNPGTPAGTYTVTISGITGTGSSLSTGSVQVTLTVAAS